MADILFIKTSSLGDVIHHMPALTEARRALPGATFAWAVEEAFAPLVRLHPAVNEVIPVAWRRWRKSMLAPATLGEISGSLRAIRARRYDDHRRQPGPAAHRHSCPLRAWPPPRLRRRQHPRAAGVAVLRRAASRQLRSARGRAQSHPLAALRSATRRRATPDFGLERARFAGGGERYAVLLHATAEPRKLWPEENWIALGKALGDLTLVLPWGTEAERARSGRLAATLPRARVPERAPLDAVAKLIAGAQFVVGVDTGLMHLAAALGVPLVAIFIGSKPGLTGPVGSGPITVLGTHGAPPSVEEVVAAAQAFER